MRANTRGSTTTTIHLVARPDIAVYLFLRA
jgi:hypothetical protein